MKTMKKLILAAAIIMIGLTATTFSSCSKEEITTGLEGTEWRGRSGDYNYNFIFEFNSAWVSWAAYEGAYITTVKAHYSEYDNNKVTLKRVGSSLHYEGVIDGDVIHLHDVYNDEKFNIRKITTR